MTDTAENSGTDNHGSEIPAAVPFAVRVPARRALVDSPSWAGYALLALALVALIAAIVIAATRPVEWALAAALVAAATGIAGVRRLAAPR